jgi:phosphatidylinositol-3-phosphatase
VFKTGRQLQFGGARRGVAVGLVVLALALAGYALYGSFLRSPQAADPTPLLSVGQPTQPPCGWRSSSSVHYAHVLWIFMENHSYGQVLGRAAAKEQPFLAYLARACAVARNYHNITHESLANYIAAVTGRRPVNRLFYLDCPVRLAWCETRDMNLFAQARQHGLSWRSYNELMPSNCDRTKGAPVGILSRLGLGRKLYQPKHNPAVYFINMRRDCASFDVPLGTYQKGALSTALDDHSLPSFAFITPDMCNDTHDCHSLARGDRWLRTWVTRIVDSASYRTDANTVLFITWDEGAGGAGHPGAHCEHPPERRERLAENDEAGPDHCHVALLVVAPSTPRGARSDAWFTHYSLLRTTEELLGLPPLGQAANAKSMVSAFSLGPVP